ncbi:MAG: hypothetical protein QF596_05200 [Acidimicrobiales bacterium]|jgi:hypothetical protein|nr:hypothetical protein [Acidimicrobiales bacterium]MDP6298899.1 hypothetical protein [Acidimicrobiales bacterium]HJM27768.1 hypothetical protein [Acidimicrobiales bacterium]HJM96714.1 hypothetical protein [Acidimicrobiales bacterium]
MSHLGYLLAGWITAVGVLAVYAWRIIQKGKELSSKVPEHRQRWMSPSQDT